MTVLVAPEMWFMQGPATDVETDKLRTSAAAFRRMLDGMLGGRQGVIYSRGTCQDLKVLATGTPDGSVHVNLGACYVRGTQAGPQGMYHLYNDGILDINVLGPNPAHATLDRIDLVVARMQDRQYSGSLDLPTIEMVTGANSATPVPPTAPANSLILAQLSIIHGTSTIPQSVITDRRVPAGNSPIVLDDILIGTDSRYLSAINLIDFLNTSGSGANLIPPGLSALEIIAVAREGGSVVTDNMGIRFNGDAGANYYRERLGYNGATSTAAEILGASNGEAGNITGGSVGDIALFGETRIWIPNPQSTVFKKMWRSQSGLSTGLTTGLHQSFETYGLWNSTAQMTRITMMSLNGNFLVGSRFALIGHVGLQP